VCLSYCSLVSNTNVEPEISKELDPQNGRNCKYLSFSCCCLQSLNSISRIAFIDVPELLIPRSEYQSVTLADIERWDNASADM